jgi:hypothetical protein
VNQVATQMLAPMSVPTLQADGAARTLALSGQLNDAPTAFALAELLHEELSWPPTPTNPESVEATRVTLADHLDSGRQRAAALGIPGGLAWLRELTDAV